MQLLSIADLARPPDQLAPIIQQVGQLGNLYKRFIEEDDETYSYTVTDYSEKSRKPGFHASELSGCFRRLVYSRWNTEKRPNHKLDVNMKMRFRIGTATHGMVQADFHRMVAKLGTTTYHGVPISITFQDEVIVSTENSATAARWDISSSCDGLFTYWYWAGAQWLPYIRVGLEIKTQSDADFGKTTEPKSDHRDQIATYMQCLDIPLFWTFYYNKSNSNFTQPEAPWLMQFDAPRWAKLENRMVSAVEHVQHATLPAREEGKPCGWCPYAWHCQPNILKRKSYNNQPNVSPTMLNRRNRHEWARASA